MCRIWAAPEILVRIGPRTCGKDPARVIVAKSGKKAPGSGETCRSLKDERALVKAYRQDYERLSSRRGHVEAVRSLVKAHKRRYDTIVREIRERERNAIQAA